MCEFLLQVEQEKLREPDVVYIGLGGGLLTEKQIYTDALGNEMSSHLTPEAMVRVHALASAAESEINLGNKALIIFTGSATNKDLRHLSEAAAMRDALPEALRANPNVQIVLEENAVDTPTNAYEVLKLLVASELQQSLVDKQTPIHVVTNGVQWYDYVKDANPLVTKNTVVEKAQQLVDGVINNRYVNFNPSEIRRGLAHMTSQSLRASIIFKRIFAKSGLNIGIVPDELILQTLPLDYPHQRQNTLRTQSIELVANSIALFLGEKAMLYALDQLREGSSVKRIINSVLKPKVHITN